MVSCLTRENCKERWLPLIFGYVAALLFFQIGENNTMGQQVKATDLRCAYTFI